MPTWLFGILLYQVPVVLGLDTFSVELRIRLLVLILIGTFAVPSLLIYFLFRSGYVRSLHLDDRLDRRLPYLITGFVYSFLTFLFAFRMQLISDVAPEIAIILGSITMSILLLGIISLFWKISAHGVRDRWQSGGRGRDSAQIQRNGSGIHPRAADSAGGLLS